MEINLLADGYRTSEEMIDTIYNDFLSDKIDMTKDYFSKELVIIDEKPSFPIYLHTTNDEKREELFVEAISKIMNHFIDTDRDIHLNGKFWHSYLIIFKRDYLLAEYPQIKESKKDFLNIVFKKFDWENYIYKCVLAAEYIDLENVTDEEAKHLMKLIANNLDIFNYLIKYNLFRNSNFIMNFLKVIDNNDLTLDMKAKIKNRPDLGKDERVGRRVVLELNNRYPVLLSPLFSYEELEEEVLTILCEYQ